MQDEEGEFGVREGGAGFRGGGAGREEGALAGAGEWEQEQGQDIVPE